MQKCRPINLANQINYPLPIGNTKREGEKTATNPVPALSDGEVRVPLTKGKI